MEQAILEQRDADECRRLADLLRMDAVGVVRGGDRRRVAWWASPELGIIPLGRILDGGAPEWLTCPVGEDLVFAHVTEGSDIRSVTALSAMLTRLGRRDDADAEPALGGVAPEDPIARERTRLAYTIHDGLTQVVTATILELEWQARRVDVSPGEAVEALTAAAGELRKALQEIRGILASLSPAEGEATPSLDQLVEGVFERWQLPATWSVEGDLAHVPAPVLDVASSVIRESVANAAKHADASQVAVEVHASRDAVEVTVQDAGKGFEPSSTGLRAGHLGLEMMRRRVAAVNGTLNIGSEPGKGTRVVARLPVSGQGVTT